LTDAVTTSIHCHVSFLRTSIAAGKAHEVEDNGMIRIMITKTSRATKAYISAAELGLKLKCLLHLNTAVTF